MTRAVTNDCLNRSATDQERRYLFGTFRSAVVAVLAHGMENRRVTVETITVDRRSYFHVRSSGRNATRGDR